MTRDKGARRATLFSPHGDLFFSPLPRLLFAAVCDGEAPKRGEVQFSGPAEGNPN